MAQNSDDVHFDQRQEGNGVYHVSATGRTIIIGSVQVTKQKTPNDINTNTDEECDEYTKPVINSVSKTAAALLDRNKDGDALPASKGQRESGKCSQPDQDVETPETIIKGR